MIILAFTNSFGQSERSLFVGLEGGTNVSKLLNNSSEQIKARAGYLVGPRVDYFLTAKFALGGGLLYVNERTLTTNSFYFSGGSLDILSRFSWLEMPLSCDYFILDKEVYSISAGLGLSVARLLASELTITTRTSLTSSAVISYYDQTIPWNFFPRIQVCTFIPSKKGMIAWVIFVQASLNDIYKDVEVNPDLSYDVYNNTVRLGVLGTSLRYSFLVSKRK